MIILHHPYITNLADVIVVRFIVKHVLILTQELESKFIASFDLTKEGFGQVYLPDGLLRSPRLRLSKLNECLTVLDYESDNNHIGQVCNVWMMKDDHVTKSFTKMLSIKLSDRLFKDVLEFRKNGDALKQLKMMIIPYFKFMIPA
uniref:Uncharacterized protein n=1 Tax=Tanacetum cinerariifolium TaxID=118510 RepID=A0A6L2MGC7_TANCI|nr:hypothetical protein [Tanacetum cinerariifolium]